MFGGRGKLVVLVVFVGLVGCDGGDASDAGALADSGGALDGGGELVDAGAPRDSGLPVGEDADIARPALPRPNAQFDYQLGGAYPPPSGAEMVVRDRSAPVAVGLYNVCYVNGFQTQPDERSFWEGEHPDLLLRDEAGGLVIDPDWGEVMLDVTTAAKRGMLLTIVGGWIAGCAGSGFDAVEIDNLDTYSRSGGRISQQDAVDFMTALSEAAHGVGLAIAQKNSAAVLDRRAEMGTDFAIVEECNLYRECVDFTAEYGDQVYVIEYDRSSFELGCSQHPDISIILRDVPLRTPSDSGYVYDGC